MDGNFGWLAWAAVAFEGAGLHGKKAETENNSILIGTWKR